VQERKVEDGGSMFHSNICTYLLIGWRHIPEGRSLNYILWPEKCQVRVMKPQN